MTRVLDGISAFLDQLAAVDYLPVFFAVLAQLAKLACTSMAWRNVLAAAYPKEEVPRRSILASYLAGVGIKRHDQYGHELSVGTEPEARGRGLARRLVAQAARRVLDEGAVPTYQHAFDNVASARVAQAAGFPDRGWTSMGVD